jgi:UDP-N-acetylglucosamine diphosphorylase / glucose-1-phosphate thymidylyltransferase / UDP-N-acetylgalactosamine diphosphorylase / glucosamine-1-phosphate N-acetyltransferase / galactosamine-1-phosphate N-acetyltransferase
MPSFIATHFFNLASYAHASLFAASEFVWDALKQIDPYLSSLQLGVLEAEISPQAYLVNPEKISIGKGSIVEAGAYVKGPCIIGENCRVRHGAYIRGGLIAGNDCVIGHDTEVKNSIFLNNTRAAHFAYVGDTILGNGVNLGAGVKCANMKFNKGQIVIHYQEERIQTGLRKFGSVIGDDSQIGCNVVLNPGSILGKNVDCYSCISVGGFIRENQTVRTNAELCFIQK